MKNQIYNIHKSSIGGMDANLMALLAYVVSIIFAWMPVIQYLAWIAPLAVFFIEKESGLVKFHAMQAFVLQAFSSALSFILSVVLSGIITASTRSLSSAYAALGITGVLGMVSFIIAIVIMVFEIMAMMGAWKYKEHYVPVAGNLAEKLVLKFQSK